MMLVTLMTLEEAADTQGGKHHVTLRNVIIHTVASWYLSGHC